MSGEWRTARLGDLLEPVKRPITLDPDTLYATLGVRWYGNGAFTKTAALGATIAAKTLNQVRAGDVVYSKLFAWKGSFAVVQAELDGVVASSEFPTYVASDELLPEYFAIWASRAEVWDEADNASTGTTANSRNRLAPEQFLDIEVELPPLGEQRRIVDAVGLARHDERHLSAAVLARDRLYRVMLAELVDGDDVSLADVISHIEAGVSPKCLPRRPRDGEFGVLSTASVRHGVFRGVEAKALPPGISVKEAARVRPGDLLTIRASGTRRLVGALCIAPDEPGNVLMSDYHWRLTVNDGVDPRYLMHATAAPVVRAQIDEAVTGSTTAGKVSQERYRAIEVPLPNLQSQRDIAAKLDTVFTGVQAYQRSSAAAARVALALADDLVVPDAESSLL